MTCEAPPALAGEAALGVDASAVCRTVGSPAHALVDVNVALWTFIPASTRILLFISRMPHRCFKAGVQGFVDHTWHVHVLGTANWWVKPEEFLL